MRGVDLNTFDFDYDLTWAAFFMNAGGKIYGRFGGRDAGPADAHLTLPALKYAMREALAAYRRDREGRGGEIERPADATKPQAGAGPAVQTVEAYPAAQRWKKEACIHCHQVYDVRREALKAAGRWSLENVWVYPPPERVGLTLALDQGNRVQSVAAGSPASRAGLRPGDTLRSLGSLTVASYADAQYALHHAPKSGRVAVTWQRGSRPRSGKLDLAEGWRRSDISWRASMWGLEPTACVYGEDLTAGEKKALGLPEKRLAFRQGQPVTAGARGAGIRPGDVILGIDDQPLMMTMLQFNAYVRVNHHVGDHVTYNVIRDGQRLNLPMVLPAHDSF